MSKTKRDNQAHIKSEQIYILNRFNKFGEHTVCSYIKLFDKQLMYIIDLNILLYKLLKLR